MRNSLPRGRARRDNRRGRFAGVLALSTVLATGGALSAMAAPAVRGVAVSGQGQFRADGQVYTFMLNVRANNAVTGAGAAGGCAVISNAMGMGCTSISRVTRGTGANANSATITGMARTVQGKQVRFEMIVADRANPNGAGRDKMILTIAGRTTQATLTRGNITIADTAPPAPVNHPPVAQPDSYSTDKDTPLVVSGPGVLGNDTDPDHDPLQARPSAPPTHGKLTLNSDGSFTYIPNTGYVGPDSFTYAAFDGKDYSPLVVRVSITVTAPLAPVNHSPVAQPDSYSTGRNTSLVVNAPGVLGNDTDPDNDPLQARPIVQPAHGKLTLNSDGSFTYIPNAGYIGLDGFSYFAFDGTVVSAVPARVSILVTNQTPVAGNDSYSTDQDTPLTVNAPGLLLNDTDGDHDPLQAYVRSAPAHGRVDTDTLDGAFVYVPDPGYSGPDSFTYRAYDGYEQSPLATVNITVNKANPVNHAPTAQNDAYRTGEDTPLTVNGPGMLANDTDPDNDPLVALVLTQPAHGTLTPDADGSFTYTPDKDYNGPDSFTYAALDGKEYSQPATVSLTVDPVNDTPVAVNDSYRTDQDTPLTVNAPGLLANDTDADHDPLQAYVRNAPAHGRVDTDTLDGAFVYIPDPGYSGPDSFTYQTYDGHEQSPLATVNITVNKVTKPDPVATVNHAPTAQNDTYTFAMNTMLTVDAPGVLGNDTDPDHDPLTAVVVSQPTHGMLFPNADGSFTYIPNQNYRGPDAFTYTAGDGKGGTSAPATVTLEPVDYPPVASDDSYSTLQNTALRMDAPGVLGNDYDPDYDPLQAHVQNQPVHGRVDVTIDGAFVYTPDPGYIGPDSFTYQADDGRGQSASATVDITVTDPNHAPTARNDTYRMAAGATTLTVNGQGVLSNDYDADHDPLQARMTTEPSNGTVSLNDDGSFTYTPNAGYSGSDSFTYQAYDGKASSQPATVTLNPPRPVEADSVSAESPLGPSLLSADMLLGGRTGPTGDPLRIDTVTQPAHGTATITPDGILYTPDRDYFSRQHQYPGEYPSWSDEFSYTVTDGHTRSAPGWIHINMF